MYGEVFANISDFLMKRTRRVLIPGEKAMSEDSQHLQQGLTIIGNIIILVIAIIIIHHYSIDSHHYHPHRPCQYFSFQRGVSEQ